MTLPRTIWALMVSASGCIRLAGRCGVAAAAGTWRGRRRVKRGDAGGAAAGKRTCSRTSASRSPAAVAVWRPLAHGNPKGAFSSKVTAYVLLPVALPLSSIRDRSGLGTTRLRARAVALAAWRFKPLPHHYTRTCCLRRGQTGIWLTALPYMPTTTLPLPLHTTHLICSACIFAAAIYFRGAGVGVDTRGYYLGVVGTAELGAARCAFPGDAARFPTKGIARRRLDTVPAPQT